MEFERKRDAALAILAKSGIWESNYRPPLLRMLWRLGVHVPPSHFASLWTIALYQGVFFCFCFGLISYFLLPLIYNPELPDTPYRFLFRCLATGAVYTVLLLIYYAYVRWKHKLPKWSEL